MAGRDARPTAGRAARQAGSPSLERQRCRPTQPTDPSRCLGHPLSECLWQKQSWHNTAGL